VYTIKRFVETRSRIDHPKVAQVRAQLPARHNMMLLLLQQ
jgi:hypothetical protein